MIFGGSFYLKRLLLILFTVWTLPLWSSDLFTELRSFRDDPNFSKRIGLEVELSGLTFDEIVKLVHQTLGGHPREHFVDYPFVDPQTGIEQNLRTREISLEESTIGRVDIKPEDNAPTLAELAQNLDDHSITEIITRPLSFHQVEIFQRTLKALKERGATGTQPDQAVSLQVNVELGGGDRSRISTASVIDILLNYVRAENRIEIAQFLKLPEIRKKFVGYPMPGLLKRMSRPDYNPTWEQFYMDSMYRASLEHLGVANAWTYSDDEARARLRELVDRFGFEVLLPVMKWQFVRYSSLMMYMRPDEWLSRYMEKTDWFKPAPILEFREPNNQFDAKGTVEWVLELVSASEKLGPFTSQELESRRLKETSCRDFLNIPKLLKIKRP